MQWRRRIVLFGILVAVILAIIYGLIPKPVSVDTAKVTRGKLRVTVEEEGKTRVRNRFVISAPAAGFARRVELDAGARVARGQVLLELEPLRPRSLDTRSRAAAEARVAASEAALKAAKENVLAAAADAEYAASEFERIKELFNSGYLAKEKLERARAEAIHRGANHRSAEFLAEVARFELEAARTALRYSASDESGRAAGTVTIRAPVNGHVLKVHKESEGVVNEGQPLIEIGDIRSLEVEVDVLSADSIRIRPGTTVSFERWGGDVSLEGRVRVVEPAGFTRISALGVEEQRVLIISDITSPPQVWKSLGDGYRLEAIFILWEGDDVLQAPSSALFRFGEGWAVFVMEDKKARRRFVRVGHRSGLTAQIISGLAEGEMVITHPDYSIEDGTRVRLR